MTDQRVRTKTPAIRRAWHILLVLMRARSCAWATGFDDVENVPRLFGFRLRHVLVMYAGTVAPPPILGSAPR